MHFCKNWCPTLRVVVAMLSVCCSSACGDGAGAGDASVEKDASIYAERGPVSCELEAVADVILRRDAWIDCGSLDAASTVAQIADAKTCAETARDQEQPFRLIWTVPGASPTVRRGIAGYTYLDEYRIMVMVHHSDAFTAADWAPCITPLTFPSDCPSGESLCASCSTPENYGCSCRPSQDGGAEPEAFCG